MVPADPGLPEVKPQHVTLIIPHASSPGRSQAITTLEAFIATRVAPRVVKHLSRLELDSTAMSKVAAGFYAVCKGREVGVFLTWYVSLRFFHVAFEQRSLGIHSSDHDAMRDVS